MIEGISKMKESYVNLLSERDHLLIMAEMYHSALKEEEEFDRLTHELEITSNSLKSTQRSLQESKLQICQIQKELKCVTLFILHERKFFSYNGGTSCGGQP